MSRSELIADEIDAVDSALLAALRVGEEAAFETLVRSYGGRMLSVARRLLGNDDDAQDAVQEAFLSAFKRRWRRSMGGRNSRRGCIGLWSTRP